MRKSKIIRFSFVLAAICGLYGCSKTNEPVIGPQGEQGIQGEPGVSIVSVNLTSSDGLVDIYTISYSDGSTSTFIVTNGKDGEQGIQGIPGNDGHAPVVTISSDGYWEVDGVKTNTKAQGEKGEPGKDGSSLLTGNGEPTYASGNNGDSYIDLDTWNFYVKTNGIWIHAGNIKGTQGNKGKDGSAVLTGDKEPMSSEGNNGDSYIDLSTWNYYVKENDEWQLKGNFKGKDGINGKDGVNGKDGINGKDGVDGKDGVNGKDGVDGKDGVNGEDGKGIVSIIKTGSSNNVDTYTITFSDGTKTTFTVTNGNDGKQGIQGVPGNDGHTPVITIGKNGNWYIDGKDSGVQAKGVQGPQGEPGKDGTDGENGLSAYEIYIKYHPEYTGSEEQWLTDLINGDLRETYEVSFQTNGGTSIETQHVKYGRLVTRPADDPTKTGYLFDGWYLNSELFPFNTYQVYDNLTLQAHWKSMNVNLTLDANGGDVEYNTKVVTYGVNYTLPTPTRSNYTFDGWYLDNTLCPISGKWNFSKTDIKLVARWAGTKAVISFANDNNLSFDNTPVTLIYGTKYTLPVPKILTGDKFIGWVDADDNLVTDENGNSLKVSSFKKNTTLYAKYYVPVTTPNQLLNLCTFKMNDVRLSRTYILQNDLDFTGLANESIKNFVGVLDGNGYTITGLENPLFKSVGLLTSEDTANAKIKISNIKFEEFSATSLIENAYKCSSLKLIDLKINSFKTDSQSYCETYGFIRNVGLKDYLAYAPYSTSLNNCHILDEFATIEGGLVYSFESGKSLYAYMCSISSNTNQCAFLSTTSQDWNHNNLVNYDQNRNYLEYNEERIEFWFCTNKGDTKGLVSVASGNLYYVGGIISSFGGEYLGNYTRLCQLVQCANYGKVEKSLVVESLNTNDIFGKYSSDTYKDSMKDNSITISGLINFGSAVSIFARNLRSSWDLSYRSVPSFNVTSCFNAGKVDRESIYIAKTRNNNYQFVPLAGIEDSGALSITNYSQINSDFFLNTIKLSPTAWNLSYINIQDEYGLPTIKYSGI